MTGRMVANWVLRNTANLITLIGFKLCFVLLWAVIFHRDQATMILFLVSGILLTDFIDGPVARYLETKGHVGSVSSFGAAIDRLRDKFFQFTMFSYFLLDPRFDHRLKGAIYPLIVMEIALLAIWFLGVRRRMNVAAGRWGKYKMFLMSIGIIACPASIVAQEHGIAVPSSVTQILLWIFIVSLFLAIMSFIKHVAKYREHLSVN
jgi:phosphatidylglycerophosphate synthase